MSPATPDNRLNEYLIRLNRSIDFVQHHYAENLNLAKLAEIACFSKYHFHRIFSALIGETVNDFVQRVRLEKSAQELILNKDRSITEIGLACGFSSSQNFARRFKAHFGVPPSFVRKEFNWQAWLVKMKQLQVKAGRNLNADELGWIDHYLRQRGLSIQKILACPPRMEVRVKHLPSLRVAYVRSLGPYLEENIRPAFSRLLRWARPKDLAGAEATVLGVVWSNSDFTPREQMVYDACLVVPEAIRADTTVNIQVLPEGRFAIYRCALTSGQHQEAWMHLLLNWLAASDYQPDNRPAYEIFRSAPTHAADPVELELCLPIKPLNV